MELDGKTYDGGVDYELLRQHGIKVEKHQPWQLGFTYIDLEGKFVWYPHKGTLMYQKNPNQKFGEVVGQKGDYPAQVPQIIDNSTARVVREIMKKVNEQSTH